MSASIELRVHGVAGTSPESMLDLGGTLREPIPDDCGEPPADEKPVQVGVYRRPDFDPPHSQVEAFRWGGLTSGRPSTARWLLLVPFVLLNAAGWATVPDGTTPTLADNGPNRSTSMRTHIALVRVGGVLLTGIAAGVVALVMDIGLMQWAFSSFEWLEDPVTRRVAKAMGFSVVALLMVGLWHWTRLRLRPDATKDKWSPASDPAGYGRLHANQAAMWNHPGIITRLRNLHLGFSLGVVGWIAAVGPTYQTGRPTSVSEAGLAAGVAGLAVLFPVVAIGFVSIRSGAQGEDAPISWWGRWPAPILGLIAALVGIWRIYRWEHAGEALPVSALRGTVILMCSLLAVIVVVTWVNQEVVRRGAPVGIRTPFRTTFTAPALMFLSLAVMVGAGASLALILVQAAGGDACRTDPTSEGCALVVGDNLDWVAIAYTAALLIAIVAATIAGLTADGSPMERIKTVVTKPARVFGWTFLIGVVATTALIAAVAVLSLPTGPDALQAWLNSNRDGAADFFGIVVGLVVAVVVVGIGGLKWGLRGIGAGAVAIVATIWAATTGKQIIVLGVPLPPTSGIQVVMAVGLLLPISAVITRLFAGMRSVEARRGLGVIWDLGMFWPRWFHPFTPPTYSDRAVTDLAGRIGGYLDPVDPAATRYDCVLVSAHSQGSVLATSALLYMSQMPGDSHLDRVGLLTHGSPWGRLYGELFPSVFNAEALTNLTTVLDGSKPGDGQQIRWRNLQRKTDPIGGPIVTAEQPWLMPDSAAFRAEVERDTENGAPAVAGSADPCNRIHSGYTLESGHNRVAFQLWSLTCGNSPDLRVSRHSTGPPGADLIEDR